MDIQVLALLLCVQVLLLPSARRSTNAMTVAGPPPQPGREWPPRRFRKKHWRSNCSGRIGSCGMPGFRGFPVPPPPPPPPPRPTPFRCLGFFHADHNNHGS